jgi:hypothetical protein
MMQEEGFSIDWGDLPLIPAGDYEAVYVSHETFNQSFGPKVKITFRIVKMGPFYEKLIDGWYNVKDLKSKPGKHRKPILSRHSKLTTELLHVLGIKERVSRLSPIQLKGKLLEVRVRTVKQNSRQKKYSDIQQYSVVDSILRSLNNYSCIELIPKTIPEPIPTQNS